ncbi:MAG: ABC transporter ATP-binding protein [Spirochaetales bacterium]|nr:ABC transporter ATP-binding protein [Spirochaetales bacterium]
MPESKESLTKGASLALLKRFARYYRPHLKLFALDMVCSFFIAGLQLLFPVITRHIVGVVIPARDLRGLLWLSGALVLLYLLVTLFNYVVNYWGHVVGTRMEADMRRDVFAHLQTLSFRFYDDSRTGQLMSRIMNDLNEITELAHHGPEHVFLAATMLLGSVIILAGIEWRLALAMVVVIPAMAWFAVSRRGRMSAAWKEVREKVADLNAQLENSISGNRVVQAFTNEKHEISKFNAMNTVFKRSRYEAYKTMAVFMSGLNLFTYLLNVLVVVMGGLLIYRGTIEVADLLAFILYINLILQPIRMLTQFTQMFEQGMTGFKRFTEIMDQKPEIVDAPGAVVLENVRGAIAFRDVTFSYDEQEHVLKGISLDIEAGKTLALVGPSGAGKTTLCNLIPRFYEVKEGEITIDDVPIRNITLASLRGSIGIVQQDVFLFSGTIRDNILYGRVTATDEEVIDAAQRAYIHDYVMSLPDGYDSYIGEKGLKLSGGQKQRVAIARAFLKNPPILLLDEATSSLDNETEIKIQAALEELSAGRTTLVIAHRLSTIHNADEIVVLTDDGIRERGSHAQLMALNGIYAGLYKAQFEGFVPDMLAIDRRAGARLMPAP